MKLFCLVFAAMLVMGGLIGCANFGETKVSMPYVTEVERTDQKIEGNRGYLKGTPPPAEDKTGRKRPFLTVDVDLPRTSSEYGVPETRFVNTNKETGAGEHQPSSTQQESVK